MKLDYHLHTIFSDDSREPMQNMCARAIELGVSEVCFTEHLDFDALSLGYYDADAYFAELYRLRERYDGKLTIRAGLEISEPHDHQKELEEAHGRPYDFIMGALHYWMGGLFPSVMRDRGMDLQRCCAHYWREMRKMVAVQGYDCVAHFDFPIRFFGDIVWQPDEIDDIFSTALQNGLVFEINTSSLRSGVAEPMPGRALLERYKACGGTHVTLGSDAHDAGALYAGVDVARELAESVGLQVARFEARERIC
ncbi:MAG: histidinol-phosphatase HisJ family protein [Oscillospiraceae bacterium]|nr:histidinol-phosphatase HisJ family protein [Oscillospiraceae bacterium]